LGEVAAGGIRRLARAQGRCRHQSLGVDVDRDDASFESAARCTRYEKGTDAARADDRDRVVFALCDAAESVKRDGKWLRHRGRIVVASVRHETADRSRRRHVLGEPSVNLKTKRAVVGAQVGAATKTPKAVPTRDPCA
jgi:hypothetical protein